MSGKENENDNKSEAENRPQGDDSAPSAESESKHEAQYREDPDSGAPETIQRDLKSLRERIRITDVLMVIATIVIAAAGVVNVIVVKGQLDEMRSTGGQTDKLIGANVKLADAARKQAEIADNQIRVIQRQIRAYLQIEVGLVTGMYTNKASVQVRVKNVGQTPAFSLVGVGAQVIVPLPFPVANPPIVFGTRPVTANFLLQGKASTIYFGPGKELNIQFERDAPFNEEELKLLTDEKGGYAVIGAIYYKDTFSEERYTHFCFFNKGQKSSATAFSLCETGNDSN
jgi:hypothetical protein